MLSVLEKLQQVFLPHKRHWKIQFKGAISFPIFYFFGVDKDQVEVPKADDDKLPQQLCLHPMRSRQAGELSKDELHEVQ